MSQVQSSFGSIKQELLLFQHSQQQLRQHLNHINQTRNKINNELINLIKDYEKKIKQLQNKLQEAASKNEQLNKQNKNYKKQIQAIQNRLLEKERLISVLVLQQNQRAGNESIILRSKSEYEKGTYKNKDKSSSIQSHLLTILNQAQAHTNQFPNQRQQTKQIKQTKDESFYKAQTQKQEQMLNQKSQFQKHTHILQEEQHHSTGQKLNKDIIDEGNSQLQGKFNQKLDQQSQTIKALTSKQKVAPPPPPPPHPVIKNKGGKKANIMAPKVNKKINQTKIVLEQNQNDPHNQGVAIENIQQTQNDVTLKSSRKSSANNPNNPKIKQQRQQKQFPTQSLKNSEAKINNSLQHNKQKFQSKTNNKVFTSQISSKDKGEDTYFEKKKEPIMGFQNIQQYENTYEQQPLSQQGLQHKKIHISAFQEPFNPSNITTLKYKEERAQEQVQRKFFPLQPESNQEQKHQIHYERHIPPPPPKKHNQNMKAKSKNNTAKAPRQIKVYQEQQPLQTQENRNLQQEPQNKGVDQIRINANTYPFQPDTHSSQDFFANLGAEKSHQNLQYNYHKNPIIEAQQSSIDYADSHSIVSSTAAYMLDSQYIPQQPSAKKQTMTAQNKKMQKKKQVKRQVKEINPDSFV